MSPLKIKIPNKICVKTKKYTNYSLSLLIIYGSSYMFRHYVAITRERCYCLLRDAQLRSSRQNIVDGRVGP
jgi:hypothetical protein